MMKSPLADKMRPKNIDEFIGQEHILGKGKPLYNAIKNKYITNMIFYGPCGIGKTTLANIMAKNTDKKFYKLNCTTAKTDDIKDIIKDINTIGNINGIILYLDEIQHFNKKQQQSLLEFMENGKITLIASTTENPYHYIHKAILSRSMIFEFKFLSNKDIMIGLCRAVKTLQSDLNIDIKTEDGALEYICDFANGDLRKSMNLLEFCIYQGFDDEVILTKDLVQKCCGKKMISYDNKDEHYDVISAFQKSIRGSDIDASLHYLARLIKVGDLASICRRLLVIACEDVGMAYPNAITIVKACVDSALMVGLPEARIMLSQAVVILASSPKSNSSYKAINIAISDLDKGYNIDVPNHLKDASYKGASNLCRGIDYKYPHDYKHAYVNQQYMPTDLKGKTYYEFKENKMEQKMRDYLNYIKTKE